MQQRAHFQLEGRLKVNSASNKKQHQYHSDTFSCCKRNATMFHITLSHKVPLAERCNCIKVQLLSLYVVC